ncbi:hypothetical protein OG937_31135 [Streptomyces sp. NBC_00510]
MLRHLGARRLPSRCAARCSDFCSSSTGGGPSPPVDVQVLGDAGPLDFRLERVGFG